MRTGAPFESSNRYLPFPFAHDAPGLVFNGATGTHGATATLPAAAFVDAIAILPPYRVYAGGGIPASAPVRLFLYSITKAVTDGHTFITLSFRNQNQVLEVNGVTLLALEFEPATLVMSRGGYGRLRASNVSTGASITLLVTQELLDYVAGTVEGTPDVFGATLPLSPETVDFDSDHVLSFSVHNTHDVEFRANPVLAWFMLRTIVGIPGTIKSDVFFVPGYRMGIAWVARYEGIWDRVGDPEHLPAFGNTLRARPADRPFRVRGPGGDRMKPHNVVFSVQRAGNRASETATNLISYLPDGALLDALTTELASGSLVVPPCPAAVSYNYLRSFSVGGVENKILPDPTGNVNIVVDNCFHLEAGGLLTIPAEDEEEEDYAANTLLLTNTCEQCCSCDKYYRVGMGIQKLATETAGLRADIVGHINWITEFTEKVTDDEFAKLLVGSSVAPNVQCDFPATDTAATVRVVTLTIRFANPNSPFTYDAAIPPLAFATLSAEQQTAQQRTYCPVPLLPAQQGRIGECYDINVVFKDATSSWLSRQISRQPVGCRINAEGAVIMPWNTPVEVSTPLAPRKAIAVHIAFHAVRTLDPSYSYPTTVPMRLTYKVATNVAGTTFRTMAYDLAVKVEVF